MRNQSFLSTVPMRGLYRPVHATGLAQAPWVSVNPNINIESPTIAPVLNIELGGLPLSLGLFAGSALSFLLRGQLQDGLPKTAALVVGAGLTVAGIANLILPKVKASDKKAVPGAPAAPAGPAVAPTPVTPGSAGPAGPDSYSASNAMAFENVTGRIVSPADFATVDVPFWRSSYPVRVQFLNSASVPVTFELELTAEEDPAPFGSHARTSLPVQVSIPAGQVKDVDVTMPISAWDSLVDYVDVVLTAKKRRVPGETAQMIDFKSFVLE